ncbi:hypothetical protein Tco_0592120, partial [Tanacetum coccineum]
GAKEHKRRSAARRGARWKAKNIAITAARSK